MDKQAILKFRPILESTLWERLVEDILEPELHKYRLELETCAEGPTLYKIRGKVEYIKYLLSLKDNAKTALLEVE